jgi:hypothetical protein
MAASIAAQDARIDQTEPFMNGCSTCSAGIAARRQGPFPNAGGRVEGRDPPEQGQQPRCSDKPVGPANLLEFAKLPLFTACRITPLMERHSAHLKTIFHAA